MSFVAWIRHVLGLDVKARVRALEQRKTHNEKSIQGAIDAFKQFAKDAER